MCGNPEESACNIWQQGEHAVKGDAEVACGAKRLTQSIACMLRRPAVTRDHLPGRQRDDGSAGVAVHPKADFGAARQIGHELPAPRGTAPQKVTRNTIAYLVGEMSTSPHSLVKMDGHGMPLGKPACCRGACDPLHATTICAVKSSIPRSHARGRAAAARSWRVQRSSQLLHEGPQYCSVLPAVVSGGLTAAQYLTVWRGRVSVIEGAQWSSTAGFASWIGTRQRAGQTRTIR